MRRIAITIRATDAPTEREGRGFVHSQHTGSANYDEKQPGHRARAIRDATRTAMDATIAHYQEIDDAIEG